MGDCDKTADAETIRYIIDALACARAWNLRIRYLAWCFKKQLCRTFGLKFGDWAVKKSQVDRAFDALL